MRAEGGGMKGKAEVRRKSGDVVSADYSGVWILSPEFCSYFNPQTQLTTRVALPNRSCLLSLILLD